MTGTDERARRDGDGRRRPDGANRGEKSDVMQAALHVEAYAHSPEDAGLLWRADGADGGGAATRQAAFPADEHDWDDVVQQTFPASDAPPPGPREDDKIR